ncbi:MAG: TIM barrel protein [Lentimonas sp.]
MKNFMFPKKIVYPVVGAVLVACSIVHAATEAKVLLNVEHSTGGFSQFDRQKFINIHSSPTEGDWEGQDDELDYVINDLDVHFGRDNGIMILYLDKAGEDASRSGFVDPAHMESMGRYHREERYAKEFVHRHQYDAKNDVMIGGQVRALWPKEGNPHGEGKPGWPLEGAVAAGEYMGHFLNEFYRDEGESPLQGAPRPKYLEILNEPLYELIDGVRGSEVTPLEIFEFHNEAAQALRTVNDTTMIGGYTMAFPIYEERDFARWDERMKLFIDTCGEYMDYISLHFYDFNDKGYKGRNYYKGGRIEATMDMMEQYSFLKLGEVRPFLVSEFGGRDHKRERQTWHPRRDWEFMKAFSPLMLSFMDRPDQILKAIPFIVAKAEWGTKNGLPYNWRLLRRANEAEGETGDEWVFTEQIKFYELWSDVNGTRVKTRSSNPDVMMDAYVDGNTAYVILSNLNPTEEAVRLNLLKPPGARVSHIRIKQLHLVGDAPQLDVVDYEGSLPELILSPEATMILEATFVDEIVLDQQATERKYYATDYNQAILGDQAVQFQLKGVEVAQNGEALLRVGFGREKPLSRQPTITFNGVELTVPTNYRGSEQAIRPDFFGMLEITVPYDLVQADNVVNITFPDSGGRVSSVTMKHFSTAEKVEAVETVGATVSESTGLEAHGMHVISQGVTFNELTFTETLDVLNDLGIEEVIAYRGQILGGGFDEKTDFASMSPEAIAYMKRICAENGIKIRHYGVAKANSPEQWRQLFAFCKDLGIQALLSEPDYDELAMVDALAQEFDVRVGIHNHALPTKYWHPDIVLKHLEGLSDHMGISGDTGNWYYSGLDPLECVQKLEAIPGRIVEIQLKDLSKHGTVPFGTGESNVAGMLHELQRQGYEGPLTIEYFGNRSMEGRAEEVRESIAYLNRVADRIPVNN